MIQAGGQGVGQSLAAQTERRNHDSAHHDSVTVPRKKLDPRFRGEWRRPEPAAATPFNYGQDSRRASAVGSRPFVLVSFILA